MKRGNGYIICKKGRTFRRIKSCKFNNYLEKSLQFYTIHWVFILMYLLLAGFK